MTESTNGGNGHDQQFSEAVAQPTPTILTNYVTGFVHDTKGRFLLLRKTRGPYEILGKLNGVGGKVEPTDFFPTSAMEREANEELGGDFGLIWHTLGLVYSEGDMANIIFHAEIDDLNDLTLPNVNDRGEQFGVYTIDKVLNEDTALGLLQILAHILTADLEKDRIEITRYKDFNVEPVAVA